MPSLKVESSHSTSKRRFITLQVCSASCAPAFPPQVHLLLRAVLTVFLRVLYVA